MLDRYFGNVCELDLIFNFHKAYHILDELLITGELQEPSKKAILRVTAAQDALMEGSGDSKTVTCTVRASLLSRALRLLKRQV